MNMQEKVYDAMQGRESANEAVWDMILEVKSDESISKNEKEKYLTLLYSTLSDKDIIQPLVSDALQYDVGTSFRGNMNDLRKTKNRMTRLGSKLLPGGGNPKIKDRAFAASLGVPVPATIAEGIRLEDVRLVPNSILKPVNGSSAKGVFFIDEDCHLHSIKTSQVYTSTFDAKSEIESYGTSISENSWLLEEAVLDANGSPANDLKVYAFYGVPAMFLEISRYRHSKPRFATSDQNRESMKLGPNYVSFEGSILPEEAWEMSRILSAESPLPFLRLDFHYGEKGLFLGEITPHPGGTYAKNLFDDVDKMLGRHFADAKARLYIDLLQGKQFPHFHKAYNGKLSF